MKKRIGIICIILLITAILLGIIYKITNVKETEELTEKELNDMQYVDEAIQQLISNENYQNASLENKVIAVENLLKDLKKQKYIKEYLYDAENSNFTFQYACGVLGGVLLKDFDPMTN